MQKKDHQPLAIKLSAWMLIVAFVVSLLYGFHFKVPIILSGGLSFLASLVLFRRLMPMQKLQVLLLFLSGLMLMLISDEGISAIERGLTINSAIIALIISVSFLRLIIATEQRQESLPEGTHSLWKTLSGVFAFSAVINFSAIAIFGDRLSAKRKLDRSQVMVLSRMFGANALWSPFFASMGAALVYSGNADLSTLLVSGLCLASCSIVITALQCIFVLHREGGRFIGYPMTMDSLVIPFLLSMLVLVAYSIFESVSILILVSSAVMLTVITLLFFRQADRVVAKIKKHIEVDLPNSANEILLFLSAGVLAVGIGAFLQTIDYTLPIEVFTGAHAILALIIMMLLSFFGIHPIVSISTAGSLLVPLSVNPNLLGILFLCCWGLSVPLSPFSAISLLIQSRYKIAATDLFSFNLGFTLLMLIPASLILLCYGN